MSGTLAEARGKRRMAWVIVLLWVAMTGANAAALLALDLSQDTQTALDDLHNTVTYALTLAAALMGVDAYHAQILPKMREGR